MAVRELNDMKGKKPQAEGSLHFIVRVVGSESPGASARHKKNLTEQNWNTFLAKTWAQVYQHLAYHYQGYFELLKVLAVARTICIIWRSDHHRARHSSSTNNGAKHDSSATSPLQRNTERPAVIKTIFGNRQSNCIRHQQNTCTCEHSEGNGINGVPNNSGSAECHPVSQKECHLSPNSLHPEPCSLP